MQILIEHKYFKIYMGVRILYYYFPLPATEITTSPVEQVIPFMCLIWKSSRMTGDSLWCYDVLVSHLTICFGTVDTRHIRTTLWLLHSTRRNYGCWFLYKRSRRTSPSNVQAGKLKLSHYLFTLDNWPPSDNSPYHHLYIPNNPIY